ncbi:uncharacterized protein L203_100631 [Cryptococcus depauperatus CBS 7841]|uniref:Uncharacterized protein n=1 Tax=Cryptococcus depauperatus CBS 7841 TaxID=1295531 RepID=A0AAJ8LXL3_9TREE
MMDNKKAQFLPWLIEHLNGQGTASINPTNGPSQNSSRWSSPIGGLRKPTIPERLAALNTEGTKIYNRRKPKQLHKSRLKSQGRHPIRSRQALRSFMSGRTPQQDVRRIGFGLNSQSGGSFMSRQPGPNLRSSRRHPYLLGPSRQYSSHPMSRPSISERIPRRYVHRTGFGLNSRPPDSFMSRQLWPNLHLPRRHPYSLGLSGQYSSHPMSRPSMSERTTQQSVHRIGSGLNSQSGGSFMFEQPWSNRRSSRQHPYPPNQFPQTSSHSKFRRPMFRHASQHVPSAGFGLNSRPPDSFMSRPPGPHLYSSRCSDPPSPSEQNSFVPTSRPSMFKVPVTGSRLSRKSESHPKLKSCLREPGASPPKPKRNVSFVDP